MSGKRILSVALAVTGIWMSSPAAADETADAIYYNGNIVTIDDARPAAGALAVKDGKILAVGAREDVLQAKGDGTRLVDLEGRTLLPGLVDSRERRHQPV